MTSTITEILTHLTWELKEQLNPPIKKKKKIGKDYRTKVMLSTSHKNLGTKNHKDSKIRREGRECEWLRHLSASSSKLVKYCSNTVTRQAHVCPRSEEKDENRRGVEFKERMGHLLFIRFSNPSKLAKPFLHA